LATNHTLKTCVTHLLSNAELPQSPTAFSARRTMKRPDLLGGQTIILLAHPLLSEWNA
jgi:hypothetical protein